MGAIETILKSGLKQKEIGGILREADNIFSKNIAISYSKAYGKAFIECFIKYPSVRMAAAFACKWFEREFFEQLENIPDFSEYASKLKLSERDKEFLNRTLRMIFILRK